jgi:hypothetical protein
MCGLWLFWLFAASVACPWRGGDGNGVRGVTGIYSAPFGRKGRRVRFVDTTRALFVFGAAGGWYGFW